MAEALAYAAIGAAIGSAATKPKKPKDKPVTPMPDEELIQQKQRQDARERRQTGRQSTILSDGLG